MTAAGHQDWTVTIEGRDHRIALGPWTVLGGAPRVVTVDGREHSLGAIVQRGPRMARFELDGRAASVERRTVVPRARLRFRAALGGSLRHLPATIAGYVIGGAGAGAGVAAASGGVPGWIVYDLTVDGTSRGAWVAAIKAGDLLAWTFVPPGGSKPDGTSLTWPDVAID